MKNIFTIIGNERILIDEKVNEIKSRYSEYNCEDIIIDLDESSIITLLNELITIPFLEDIKVITLQNPNFIYDSKKIDSKLIEAFLSYLERPNDTTVLIVVLSKEMNNSVMKKLKENSTLISMPKVDPSNLGEYVSSNFVKDEFKISRKAQEELISRVDHDVNRVLIEIEKLKIYKVDTKKIEYDDVVLLVTKDLEDNIFNLVDAVLHKNKGRILDIYEDLMVKNVEETFIISSLVSKFNEMYQTKTLLESGIKKDEIAQIFNVKPGRAYYMIQNASLVSLKAIKENINNLIELDYNIKSGRIAKKLGLDIYLLSI